MKDYRSLERYSIDEWEEDKEWLGNRLDTLWSIRDYNFELYMKNNLNLEKNDFYKYNDNEVSRIASNRHHSVDIKKYDYIYKRVSVAEQKMRYKKLEDLKNNSLKEFLKKDNCNHYEYFRYKDADGFFYEIEREVY